MIPWKIKWNNYKHWPHKCHDYPVWLPFAIFYPLLFVIPNNRFMGVALFGVFLLSLYRTNSIFRTLYFMTILCLLFTKGKGFQFILLGPAQTWHGIPFTFDFDLTFWNFFLFLLIYMIFRNRHAFKKIPVYISDVFLMCFVISLIPSTLFSQHPNLSVLGFIEIICMVLLYLITRVIGSYVVWNMISLIVSFQLIFEGFLSLSQFLIKGPLGLAIESVGGLLSQSNNIEYAIEQVGFFRSRGTFDNSNSLGTFAACLLPYISILLIYKRNTTIEKIIYSLGVLAGITAVIVSGSRTSFFVTAAFFTGIFYVQRRAAVSYLRTGVLTKVVIVSLFVASLPTIIVPRVTQLYITLQPGGGLTFRTDLIRYAIQMLRVNVIGVGLGMFPVVLFRSIGTFFSFPTEPHNLFAQIAAEGGFWALVFFCLFLLTAFIPYIKKALCTSRDNNPYQTAAAASLFSILIVSNAYPFLLRSSIFPYFWALLAAIV